MSLSSRSRAWIGVALALVLVSGAAGAQEPLPGLADVFLAPDDPPGGATIYFVDALTGLSTVVSVADGTDFTLSGDAVIYRKTLSGAIMRVRASGAIEPHPFLRWSPDLASLNWVVSPDGDAIAWVEQGIDGSTHSYLALADGSDRRELPLPAPPAGTRLVPVALADKLALFVYDAAAPLEPAAGTPYTVVHAPRVYDPLGEAFIPFDDALPCPCATGISANGRWIARLQAPGGSGPFALNLSDSGSGAAVRLQPPALDFRLAGDVVVSATGTLAAYSVASGTGESGPVQYGVVLADARARQQWLVVSSGAVRMRPIRFTDQDAALLLADAAQGGTHKLELATGQLTRVSHRTYLGTVALDR